MTPLVSRILVSTAGIPLIFAAIYLGSYYFLGVILIISCISGWEFYNLVKTKGYEPLSIAGLLSLILLETTVFMFSLSNNIIELVGYIAVFIIELFAIFIIIQILGMIVFKKDTIVNISITYTGIGYVLIPYASLLIIRINNWGFSDLVLFYFIAAYFVTIWICDTFAYFVGINFGKHKISSRISPKKSWEGAIAGLISAILTFCLLGHFLKFPFNIFELILFGVVIGVFGQIGDFAESALKRDAGIKDSSRLLLDHGGVLDRFDSFTFTAPIILILLIFFST